MKYRSFLIREFVVTAILRRFARKNAEFAPRMVISSNDYIGHWLNVAGGYELQLLEPAMNFIRQRSHDPNLACLDVGANIGNHAVYFSKHFKQVLAVEANPTVFRLLSLNAEGREIACCNVAAGDSSGFASIRLADPTNEGTGALAIEPEFERLVDATTIPIKRLDEIAAEFADSVGLIKIDVEGMEQAVLRGARQIIERNRPVILYEYHHHLQNGDDTFDLLRTEFGYERFYYVGPKFEFAGRSNLASRIAEIAVNALGNFPFTVKPVDPARRRSYDLVIALGD